MDALMKQRWPSRLNVNKFARFVRVRSDNRMHGLAEKSQKLFVGLVEEIEARVVKDPIVLPIIIPDAMLKDVGGSRFISVILRMQAVRVVEP
jgi:hypothetical protein